MKKYIYIIPAKHDKNILKKLAYCNNMLCNRKLINKTPVQSWPGTSKNDVEKIQVTL
jgi:hypothetical protein